MKRNIFVLFLGMFIISGCPKPIPYVQPHPTPIVTDNEFCGPAEENLKNLGCISKDAPYTKKGKSFTQFCQDTQSNGIFLNPKCLAKIISCQQMDQLDETNICPVKIE